jgi:hypothetical protein
MLGNYGPIYRTTSAFEKDGKRCSVLLFADAPAVNYGAFSSHFQICKRCSVAKQVQVCKATINYAPFAANSLSTFL